MLNSDVSLVRDLTASNSDTNTGAVSCHFNSNTGTPDCPMRSTINFAIEFSNSNDLWLQEFKATLDLMLTNGYNRVPCNDSVCKLGNNRVSPTAPPVGAVKPTLRPSLPTKQPSLQALVSPTALRPSQLPTQRPSPQPTQRPSARPTLRPSPQPTSRPSARPTLLPSPQPTQPPSPQPTERPTPPPSPQPTPPPSPQPTAFPPIKPKLMMSLPIDAAMRAFALGSRPGFLLRHYNFDAYLNQLSPLSSGLERDDSSFYTRKANAGGATCYSFESKNNPNHFLRHSWFKLLLNKDDGTHLFAADSTFCVVPGLSGSGFSLQAVNYPSKYIHVRPNHEFWIDDSDGTTAFAQAASFTQAQQYLPVDGNRYSFAPVRFPDYLVRHANF